MFYMNILQQCQLFECPTHLNVKYKRFYCNNEVMDGGEHRTMNGLLLGEWRFLTVWKPGHNQAQGSELVPE